MLTRILITIGCLVWVTIWIILFWSFFNFEPVGIVTIPFAIVIAIAIPTIFAWLGFGVQLLWHWIKTGEKK